MLVWNFERIRRGRDLYVGYANLDYTGDVDKRRSMAAYVFTLAGAFIWWSSILQSIVALSITGAECLALIKTIKETIWLQVLLIYLDVRQEHLRVKCDSTSAIHLVKNHAFHARTKHINVRYHFVWEILENATLRWRRLIPKRSSRLDHKGG